MKVFCDTNIIIEYLFKRKEAETIRRIFHYLSRMDVEKVLSCGSFYTLTYLIENYLKKDGLEKDERISELRRILNGLLLEYHIESGISWKAGIDDIHFNDIEDSYQYQAALSSGCDVLLTLNIHDFQHVSPTLLKIYTPVEFLAEYGDNNVSTQN